MSGCKISATSEPLDNPSEIVEGSVIPEAGSAAPLLHHRVADMSHLHESQRLFLKNLPELTATHFSLVHHMQSQNTPGLYRLVMLCRLWWSMSPETLVGLTVLPSLQGTPCCDEQQDCQCGIHQGFSPRGKLLCDILHGHAHFDAQLGPIAVQVCRKLSG